MELLTARPEGPLQTRWRQNGWASDWVNGSRKCDFISTRGDITQTQTHTHVSLANRHADRLAIWRAISSGPLKTD